MPKILKCRLCNWQTQAYWKSKKGKLVSGFNRLRDHYEDCHESEFITIEESIEREFEGKE